MVASGAKKKREHIVNIDTQQDGGTTGVTRYISYCAQGGEVDRSTQWLTVGWSAAPTESAGSHPLTTPRRWGSTNYAALGTREKQAEGRGVNELEDDPHHTWAGGTSLPGNKGKLDPRDRRGCSQHPPPCRGPLATSRGLEHPLGPAGRPRLR